MDNTTTPKLKAPDQFAGAHGSADGDDRENLMAAEASLMKAATEFAYQWGRDQTVHPKMYWLELHLETWAKLAKAALAYSERVNPPNNALSQGGPASNECKQEPTPPLAPANG